MRPPFSPGAKFSDPQWTAKGEPRASVPLRALETLWVNTGTLCNLTCQGCYIESSPHNDRLSWFTPKDLSTCLTEASSLALPLREIGFTGGEPFMNPDIIDLLSLALDYQNAVGHGAQVLVLTNGLTPLRHKKAALADLAARHPGRLTIRLSLDHHQAREHERLRGEKTFAPTLDAAQWLSQQPLTLALAGRSCFGESEQAARAGYAALCTAYGLEINCDDPASLVLFPEMEEASIEATHVPEITTACWSILDLSPDAVMCSSARMVVRRAGQTQPTVLACTLIAYDPQFELGSHLADSLRPVPLNHPHCARFCVLGGARCSV